jgi:hypothetical protein
MVWRWHTQSTWKVGLLPRGECIIDPGPLHLATFHLSYIYVPLVQHSSLEETTPIKANAIHKTTQELRGVATGVYLYESATKQIPILHVACVYSSHLA